MHNHIEIHEISTYIDIHKGTHLRPRHKQIEENNLIEINWRMSHKVICKKALQNDFIISCVQKDNESNTCYLLGSAIKVTWHHKGQWFWQVLKDHRIVYFDQKCIVFICYFPQKLSSPKKKKIIFLKKRIKMNHAFCVVRTFTKLTRIICW